MHFELRSNGKNEIQIEPDTEIEAAFVKAFLGAAEKGATIRLSQAANAPLAMVMSVEK
jgi:hypothetical protein